MAEHNGSGNTQPEASGWPMSSKAKEGMEQYYGLSKQLGVPTKDFSQAVTLAWELGWTGEVNEYFNLEIALEALKWLESQAGG